MKNELEHPFWNALDQGEQIWMTALFDTGYYTNDELNYYLDLIINPQSTHDLIHEYINRYWHLYDPDRQDLTEENRNIRNFVQRFVGFNREILETQENTVYVQGKLTPDSPYGFQLNVLLMSEHGTDTAFSQTMDWQRRMEEFWKKEDAAIGSLNWDRIYRYENLLRTGRPEDIRSNFKEIDTAFALIQPLIIGTPVYTPGGEFGQPDLTIIEENRGRVLFMCDENRLIAAKLYFEMEEAVGGK